MNLLTDQWIPTQDGTRIELVTLQETLCSEHDYKIALSRDDMELACLQLLVCLVQVLFLPEDEKTWKRRIREPLTAEEYALAIQNYIDWFDLTHPETPFMQVRGVKAKSQTPIQKLFVGLPEGTNHAFFNDPGEILAISQSSAAIALFNQAMNSPSMGGGFKGGFRGGAPITTLMSGNTLRQTIWFNTLHKQSILAFMPNYDELKKKDKPTWVEPIRARSSIPAHEIGLLRGLFWQPAHIELELSDAYGACDFFGLPQTNKLVVGFNKEKFVYNIVGEWPHPHSPSVIDLKSKAIKYLSFTTTAPAWTQLNHLLVQSQDKKQGHRPATVVQQFREVAASDQLIVGGYRNKQASILQRRHETFPLSSGWDKSGNQVSSLVETAVEIKKLLRNKLFGFGKAAGVAGVHEEAEAVFYRQSETIIHTALREIDWTNAGNYLQSLRDELIQLSWQIFKDLTRPYTHEPKMIKALAVTRSTLIKGFNKMEEKIL